MPTPSHSPISDSSSIAVGSPFWAAAVMSGPVSFDGSPPTAASKSSATGDRAAMRLTDYFLMLAEFEDERGLKPEQRQALVAAGRQWLIAYGAFRNTPEGFGVQYIIAPMVETPYALSKYALARDKSFTSDEARRSPRSSSATSSRTRLWLSICSGAIRIASRNAATTASG